MKIYNVPRGSGKTTKLIHLSECLNAPILCATQKHRSIILSDSRKMNVKIPKPITVRDLVNGKLRGTNHSAVLVDEMPMIFERLISYFGVNCLASTMSADMQKLNKEGIAE